MPAAQVGGPEFKCLTLTRQTGCANHLGLDTGFTGAYWLPMRDPILRGRLRQEIPDVLNFAQVYEEVHSHTHTLITRIHTQTTQKKTTLLAFKSETTGHTHLKHIIVWFINTFTKLRAMTSVPIWNILIIPTKTSLIYWGSLLWRPSINFFFSAGDFSRNGITYPLALCDGLFLTS